MKGEVKEIMGIQPRRLKQTADIGQQPQSHTRLWFATLALVLYLTWIIVSDGILDSSCSKLISH